ncbi:MAG: ExeA family protein [Gammaproteobacteria bacterium]
MYTDFYKFSGKPFALTPDLRFLFRSESHKRALSYLHYGLEQAEGFVVITGDIGTGKTLLIQALLEDLKTQEIATARVAAANLTKQEIIPMVAAALKQPYEGKSKTALIRDLELSLRRAREYLKGVLLIVDEAQTLTPDALEELRILSNLESNGHALLQIFLVGQSDFRETLLLTEMEPLRQRTVASYHMAHLTRAELKRYIGFRLLAVGWEGNPAIDNDVYDVVLDFTDGIPRRINIFMDRFLVYGFLEEITEFTREHAEAVAEEFSNELAGDFLKPVLRERAQAKSREHNEKDRIESDEEDENDAVDTDFDTDEFEPGPFARNGNGSARVQALPPSIDDTSSSPLEKRLRGLDRKLKKLGEKSRHQRNR